MSVGKWLGAGVIVAAFTGAIGIGILWEAYRRMDL